MISSRAISPKWALIIASVFEFVGAYFLGTAVAATMGKGIVDPTHFLGQAGVLIVIGTLLGAVGWNMLTWYYGIPSSSSHALIGGMLGSFIFAAGFDFANFTFSFETGVKVIYWKKVGQIFLVLIASPFIGGLAGFFFMKATTWFFRHAPPAANVLFKRLQIASSIGLALSHGTNDAQKTMGVITLSLIILGFQPGAADGAKFFVQDWVILACSAAIAIGIATGGWTIIKTLGMKLFKVRAVHGFSAQTCSGAVLYTTAVLGFPVSTTQIIGSSVMGTGAAQRANAVRWGVIGNILIAWLLTIPCAALLGGAAYFAVRMAWDRM
ncbi:inorganic phosphate transporter [bacterium]|nr:inorganic phosphate transporter [bacterium]